MGSLFSFKTFFDIGLTTPNSLSQVNVLKVVFIIALKIYFTLESFPWKVSNCFSTLAKENLNLFNWFVNVLGGEISFDKLINWLGFPSAHSIIPKSSIFIPEWSNFLLVNDITNSPDMSSLS